MHTTVCMCIYIYIYIHIHIVCEVTAAADNYDLPVPVNPYLDPTPRVLSVSARGVADAAAKNVCVRASMCLLCFFLCLGGHLYLSFIFHDILAIGYSDARLPIDYQSANPNATPFR